MRQRPTEQEAEEAIQAIMRDGYSRRYAEMAFAAEWAEAHGLPLGCTNDEPIDTIEDLVAHYGEEGAAEILRHPIERARFGLPPLDEAEAPRAEGATRAAGT